jgi:hypothetical protein
MAGILENTGTRSTSIRIGAIYDQGLLLTSK